VTALGFAITVVDFAADRAAVDGGFRRRHVSTEVGENAMDGFGEIDDPPRSRSPTRRTSDPAR